MSSILKKSTIKESLSSSSSKVRKLTFSEKASVTNDEQTQKQKKTPVNPYNTSTTAATNNQQQQQKKQKQSHNTTNNMPKSNKNKADNNRTITSFYASAPARSDKRVRNSRAAILASSKGRPARTGSSKEITFNHKFRYDVQITLTSTNLEARQTELQQHIDELLSIINDEDKSARLLPWKSSKQDRHPAISSSDETSGSFVDIYLSRSWLGNLEGKHRLYLKLYIGHDKGYASNILPALEDWNSHSDRSFKYCMIQAEETAFIGWFLYSTVSIDAGGLSDAIFEEYGFEVGLRWMDVRVSQQKGKKIKSKTKPIKALHVEVEKDKSRKIMEQLMKNYGRSFSTTRNFPLGIRLRFCKNVDNAAYKAEKTKLLHLRSRQGQLLEETQRASSAGILDLDAILQEETSINETTSVTSTTIITLRDAIMDIKSKKVKDTPLFRSVDISYNSDDYVLAYHQSMADEAKAMIDYLYPYLLHLYPKQALKKAFDSTHIKEMSSFKYNLVSDEVEDTVAEAMYAAMEKDNITGEIEFAQFDLSSMEIDDQHSNEERPQASILGKMYSGTDSVSTQHYAGKSRAPQRTDEDIIEITPDELQELQRAMIIHTQIKDKTSERKNTLHIANFDTSTVLNQIRASKAAKLANKRAAEVSQPMENDEDSSQSEDEDNDEEMELQDGMQVDDETYHDTEDISTAMDEHENQSMEEDIKDSDDSDDSDSSNSDQPRATHREQIDQSQTVGNDLSALETVESDGL